MSRHGFGAWLLLMSSICFSLSGCSSREMAVERASKEFSCPVDSVRVVERSDIEVGLYDVGGCGQRARYLCFIEKYSSHCIREPDPPTWSPDPLAPQTSREARRIR